MKPSWHVGDPPPLMNMEFFSKAVTFLSILVWNSRESGVFVQNGE